MLSNRQTQNMPHDQVHRPASKPISEIIADGRCFLADLDAFLLETGGLFRSGREAHAKDYFVQVVEALQWLVVFINEIAVTSRVEPGMASVTGPDIDKSVDNLNMVLTEMVSSQEKSDWVLLADLMEYELAPRLREWDEICARLQSEIPGKAR